MTQLWLSLKSNTWARRVCLLSVCSVDEQKAGRVMEWLSTE